MIIKYKTAIKPKKIVASISRFKYWQQCNIIQND